MIEAGPSLPTWAVATSIGMVLLPPLLGAWLAQGRGVGVLVLSGVLVLLDVAWLRTPLWDAVWVAGGLAAGALVSSWMPALRARALLLGGLLGGAALAEVVGRGLLPEVGRAPVTVRPWMRVGTMFPNGLGGTLGDEAAACALAFAEPADPERPPAVLHLGDSIVHGSGVRPEEAVVAQLGRNEPAVHHRVAATPGVGPDVLLLALRRQLQRGPWDQVVLYLFPGNDVAEVDWPYACCPGGPLLDASLGARCEAPTHPSSIELWLQSSPPPLPIRVGGEVSRVLAHVDARWSGWRGRQVHGFTPSTIEAGQRRVVAIAIAMTAEVRAAGAVPTVVVLPDPRPDPRGNLTADVVASLTRAGVDPVDARAWLASAGPEDFVDPIHLSPAGHARLAAWLGPELTRRRTSLGARGPQDEVAPR